MQDDERAASVYLDQLRVAAAFLSRLPVEGSKAPGALAAAAWAFPVVGAGVGLAAGLVYAGALALGLPVSVAALLALGAGTLATGALHEDGLADTVDGLAGGRDRDETLAIMRDGRVGAMGALALIFSVGLRAAALIEIATLGAAGAPLALVAAGALGRAAIAAAMRLEKPARADGLAALAGTPSGPVAAAAIGLGALLAALALLPLGVAALAGAALGAFVAAWAMAGIAVRRVGGTTGDILGAVAQAAETASLLGIAASLAAP